MNAVRAKRRLGKIAVSTFCDENYTRLGGPNIQNHNPKDRRSRTQLALGSISVFPVVASTLAATAIRPSLLIVFVIALRIIITLPLRFTLRDIGCKANPSSKPQHSIQHVDTSKGIDVSESPGSRPHGDGYQVNQTGNTEPALSQERKSAYWTYTGRLDIESAGKHTKAQYHAVRPSIPSPFVQIAMVRAQARKMSSACTPWVTFFIRPGLTEGRPSFIIAEKRRRKKKKKKKQRLSSMTGSYKNSNARVSWNRCRHTVRRGIFDKIASGFRETRLLSSRVVLVRVVSA